MSGNGRNFIRSMARDLISFALFMFLIGPSLALAGGVHALFNLGRPAGGPFPSDWFTVADRSHLTGLRVNLPKPDCLERPSDCDDIDVINTLDGFNNQPRLSVPFDGAIDVDTVSTRTVFLIELRCRHDKRMMAAMTTKKCDDDRHRGVKVVGINQVVWDTFTNTLHVESDELLDQHTRYALIVTRGVRDLYGSRIEATQAFRRFRQNVRGLYKEALVDAIHAARRLGVREEEIAVASVFTTQSVTAILEKIRDQIKANMPAPADFLLGPSGERTVFPLNQVTGIAWRQQTRDNPPAFTSAQVDLALLRLIPDAVGQIAFGKYVSPDYVVHPDELIPPIGTRSGTPEVQGVNELFFNLYLPSGPKPLHGWPVAIFAHGGMATKEQVFSVAALAQQGIATIAANAKGRGFGPLGTLTVNRTAGDPLTFPSGGRGSDQDGDGTIAAEEGDDAIGPWRIIGSRDSNRQAVAELMQLVRVIEAGMDVDGDGVSELDASRIYYLGFSFGGGNGVISLAIEPNVRVGVLNVPGSGLSGQMEAWRFRLANRDAVGRALASRTPSLINPPGITRIDGVSVSSAFFNENLPLRDGVPLAVELADGTSHEIQSPVVNTVLGAMEIQQVFEHAQWASQSGDPSAYAPYLQKSPLPGSDAKAILVQMAKGDRTVVQPRITETLRAGELAEVTTFYRNDLAFAEDNRLPTNPHDFMRRVDQPLELARQIANGAQDQIAIFLRTGGGQIIHPEPARFFEVPIVLPLPEGLDFIQ